MINRLLNQLATSSDAEPHRPTARPAAKDGFAREMSKQLLGARMAPARDAEGDATDGDIAGAVRRHVGDPPASADREPSLTGLLLDPPPTSEEVSDDVKSFEDERTAPELPSLRSASMESPIPASPLPTPRAPSDPSTLDKTVLSGSAPSRQTPAYQPPAKPTLPNPTLANRTPASRTPSSRTSVNQTPASRSAAHQTPASRSAAHQPPASRAASGHGPSTTAADELLREQAFARFSGDVSSSAKVALERTPAQPLPRARDAARYRAHTIPVQARGAATFIPVREGSGPMVRSVEQPGEPRVERITKPIKPSLLKPSPPDAAFHADALGRPGAAARGERPVTLNRPEQWATPQIVKTVDGAWRPRVDDDGAAADAAPAKAAPARVAEPHDAQTPQAPEPVVDAADTTPHTRVGDTLRAYVSGQRAQLASPSEATSRVMQGVVEQVRSLMDGLGLEGQLKLRTDGAEVQVQSDTLGTLAARIGVEHGVVDLTLSGQAAASLTAELDALKAMLAEAGLTVGTVKTGSLTSSDQEGDRERPGERDQDGTPRSGSAVAEQEGDARGSSRTRRRAHHGQVNVSA